MSPVVHFENESSTVQIKGDVSLLNVSITHPNGTREKFIGLFIDREKNKQEFIKNKEKGLISVTSDAEGKVNDGTCSVATDSSIPVEIIKEDSMSS